MPGTQPQSISQGPQQEQEQQQEHARSTIGTGIGVSVPLRPLGDAPSRHLPRPIRDLDQTKRRAGGREDGERDGASMASHAAPNFHDQPDSDLGDVS